MAATALCQGSRVCAGLMARGTTCSAAEKRRNFVATSAFLPRAISQRRTPPHQDNPESSEIMGRELQKKKNKSSIPKRRHKPKSKKKILANPIIAANWYFPVPILAIGKSDCTVGTRRRRSLRITAVLASPHASITLRVALKKLSNSSASTTQTQTFQPLARPTTSTLWGTLATLTLAKHRSSETPRLGLFCV